MPYEKIEHLPHDKWFAMIAAGVVYGVFLAAIVLIVLLFIKSVIWFWNL